MRRFFLILFLFSCSFCSVLYANSFDILKRFSIDNPLSYKAIYAIAQDHDGFMWFGSQEGLHRYDGYEVITYLHDDLVNDSLSADVISHILVDSKGRLWVATREGLNLFNPLSNGFTHFKKNEQYSMSSDNINTLIEDSKGNIWVGTEKGIDVLTEFNGEWKIKKINAEIQNMPIHAIAEVEEGVIWIGTNGNGVYQLKDNDKHYVLIDFSDLSNDVSFGKLVNALFKGTDGNVWIGTAESGLIKVNRRTGKKSHYTDSSFGHNTITSNTVESIYQDSKNNVWVATDKGLSVYRSEYEHFVKVNHSSGNNNSLSGNFVLSVFEDNSQIVWIGTMSGTNRWDPYMATFRQYDKSNHYALSSKLVTAFSEYSKNTILISTYEGELYKLDHLSGDLSLYLSAHDLGNVRISALFYENETIWIGTRSSGLIKYAVKEKALTHYQFDPNNEHSISANSITNIFRDSRNKLWVSTYHNGLNAYLGDNVFKRFVKNDNQVNKGPSTHHILQVLEDKFGDIWLATYGGGLNRLNVDDEVFTHITHDATNNFSLSSDLAWIMSFDHQGNLWVGTQAAGINYLSIKKIKQKVYQFDHLNVKDGMKDQTVYGLIQDEHNNIWFSSNNGISRYSPESKTFKHFDNRHGLTDLEFNHSAILKASNNTLFFGSARGFNSIEPNQLVNNQPAPTVKLNHIYKLNEPIIFEQPLSELKTITFDYLDPLISFEYVGLNYSEPEATRYKYRLLGFDDEWIDAGKLRRATYTNLPAGNYSFQVKAANSDNVWSNPVYQLDVIVLPAPWNTWWAYLLYVLILASALLVYARFMNKKLVLEQQHKALLKAQVIEKTEKYTQKNQELEKANVALEKAAITDKITGVKSRRYLDIYIEQTSQLMTQIHKNLLPIQKEQLPRLYIVMVQVRGLEIINDSRLFNLVELMQYSRNVDDLVVRWSEDTFAIIGYEKENSAAELSARLSSRFQDKFNNQVAIQIVYNYYPFDVEQPLSLSWDQMSVLSELALSVIEKDKHLHWLGLLGPKLDRFQYIELLSATSTSQLAEHVYLKYH